MGSRFPYTIASKVSHLQRGSLSPHPFRLAPWFTCRSPAQPATIPTRSFTFGYPYPPTRAGSISQTLIFLRRPSALELSCTPGLRPYISHPHHQLLRISRPYHRKWSRRRSFSDFFGDFNGRNKGLVGIGAISTGVLAIVLFFKKDPALLDSGDLAAAILKPGDQTAHPREEFELVTTNQNSFLFHLYSFFSPLFTFFRFCHLAILFLPLCLTSPVLLIPAPQDTPSRSGLGWEAEMGLTNGELGNEHWITRWWYGLLVKQMERAGPTFIKLGQWASSRHDIFSPTLCSLFSRLQSNGNPHSFEYTKKVIERELCQRGTEKLGKGVIGFDDVFEEFDRTPIGVGAVAQVYRAVLKPSFLHHSSNTSSSHPTSSQVVAVKVLHPRVAKIISRDLSIMSFFANSINFLLPSARWISLPDEVDVFGRLMNSQLNLKEEGDNLDRFERNFQNREHKKGEFVVPGMVGGGTVRFPKPVWELTGKELLVEEFEDAIPLKCFLRGRKIRKDGNGDSDNNAVGPFDEKIANLGLDAFLNMLLLDNFCHTDLHAGNIMVKFYHPTTGSILQSFYNKAPNDPAEDPKTSGPPEIIHKLQHLCHDEHYNPEEWNQCLDQLGEEGYQPELVFLDAGLVTELNDVNRRNFIDLFRAVAEFDGYKAGKLMVDRCRSPELVIDQETFALRIQHLVLSVKSQTFSLSKIKISDVLSEVLFSVRKHHVRLEADFVNTVISILLLEGIGRQLDPELDLFKSALPILRRLGRQLNSPESIKEGYESGSLSPYLKIWIWVEAKSMLSTATSEIDQLVRDDLLTPSL